MSESYSEPRQSAPTRRIGKVKPVTDRLAYQRIVYLRMDFAILFSAVQNFRIDLAKGYHHSAEVWSSVGPSYFGEAGDLMREDGCNHYPGNNDEPWYHVSTIGQSISGPSERAIELKEAFDLIFFKNDPALFDSALYPTPENTNTDKKIRDLVTTLRHRYHFGYN